MVCMVVFFSTMALAGPAQYQVTGPVLEVTDNTIVVQKGNEKWEISRDKATVLSGDLKVGSKVTVFYTMHAAKIEVKEAPKTPAAPKKK
jgi:RNase P/RNase MRP subunit p29